MPRPVFLLALWLCGCTVGPNFFKPTPKLPADWTEQQASENQQKAAAALKVWWTGFHDPMLDGLISDVVAGNLRLQIAQQNLLASRAARIIAGAGAYPQIRAGAQFDQANSSTTLQYPPGVGAYRTYAFGFDASWELDVFGATRRQEEAADADTQASIESRRAILVTLLSELATDYAGLRATQERMLIAQRNIDTARRAFDLTSTEFDRGLTTDLAVAQAKARLESVQAGLPLLHARAAALTHAIAVLTGHLPAEMEARLLQGAPVVPVPPDLPLTLPSEVVANRPDIRRAEKNYAAATARIGVATAQLYPHFSIPVSLMPTTSYLNEAFNAASLVWAIGLSSTQTLYDGGRLDAQVNQAKANAEAARLTYQQAVLTAFSEVEDALVNLQAETQRHQALVAAAADSRTAADRAERLYGAGLTDFLNVLSTEQTLYAAEDEVAVSDLDRVRQVVNLYQALGGGWQSFDQSPGSEDPDRHPGRAPQSAADTSDGPCSGC
jgi:NodT family efflux transporter outer membrane factor (OMF) lipoprotein